MIATADKPRVLVVDDNEDAATTLGLLLETAGYEVKTCFDPKEALKAADRFDPDACVLDINMPGMDGYELARRLRAKDPDHPPVMATVTAYEDYRHLTQAADAGFDLHFTKPANPAEVLDQIGDCVRKHSEERAIARAADGLAEGLLAEIDAEAGEEPAIRPAVWVGLGGVALAMVGVLVFVVGWAI